MKATDEEKIITMMNEELCDRDYNRLYNNLDYYVQLINDEMASYKSLRNFFRLLGNKDTNSKFIMFRKEQ